MLNNSHHVTVEFNGLLQSLGCNESLCFRVSEHVLDPLIRYEPQQRDEDIQAQGDSLVPQGQRNGDGVQSRL